LYLTVRSAEEEVAEKYRLTSSLVGRLLSATSSVESCPSWILKNSRIIPETRLRNLEGKKNKMENGWEFQIRRARENIADSCEDVS
jgi:hypothetical protein